MVSTEDEKPGTGATLKIYVLHSTGGQALAVGSQKSSIHFQCMFVFSRVSSIDNIYHTQKIYVSVILLQKCCIWKVFVALLSGLLFFFN